MSSVVMWVWRVSVRVFVRESVPWYWCVTGVWHNSFMCLSRFIHMCAMTLFHSYVCHDTVSFICVAWNFFIHMGGTTVFHSYVCHDTFSCMYQRVSRVCDITHSYVCQDIFICVARHFFIHMCGTTLFHSYVWHDTFSFIYVAWHVFMYVSEGVQRHVREPLFDMTHAYVWHDSFSCV